MTCGSSCARVCTCASLCVCVRAHVCACVCARQKERTRHVFQFFPLLRVPVGDDHLSGVSDVCNRVFVCLREKTKEREKENPRAQERDRSSCQAGSP